MNLSATPGSGLLGTSPTITLDGGTLKLTPQGAGQLQFGTDRTIAFGATGGTLDLTNTVGGNLANGSTDTLAITTTAGATSPAVIQWNGGATGLSTNTTNSGDWVLTSNALRLRTLSGTGPLRIEVTNGALLRASITTGGVDNTIATPLTLRGVLGGDPTSGPAGTISSGTSLTTGRYMFDNNRITYSGGLTFEGAMQVVPANRSTAMNGNITVASGGYVGFQGRSTGTNLSSAIQAPGGTGNPGHNVLWIGENASTTLTIQSGGTAVFDARLRIDQNNAHGVLLGGNAVLEGGGALTIQQSISNFSAITGTANFNTNNNVGDIILRGDLTGKGSTANEAVLNLLLPAPNAAGTTATGVPTPLAATAPAAGTRPFGGLVAEAAHDIIINGTGFGGLRVNSAARPDRLFSDTQTPGGNATPDPVSSLTKINDYLTPARISAVSGSGGYLTVAPAGAPYTVPNAEWNAGSTVGLKVVNHFAGGADVQFDPAKTSWGHNLAVDAGAELSTGANPFTLTAGTLHGTGIVSGAGGITIGPGAGVSPGLGGIGVLTVGNITIDGALLADVSNVSATAADRLAVTGNLAFGGSSVLQIAPGSTLNGGAYTLLTYSGTRTGQFSTAAGLPLGYALNYDTPGEVRLVFASVQTRIWNGAPGNIWSANPANANWQGGTAFSNGDAAIFDDTAAGSTTVAINGVVEPGSITFNNSAKNYVLAGSAGNAISGPAALTKNGSGALEIQGVHNYGSGTAINAGTVRLGNNDALPNNGAIEVKAGAILDLNGKTDTIGDLTVGGSVTPGIVATAASLNVGSLTLGAGATYTAGLTLRGGMTKTGAGSATLTGAVDLGQAARTWTVEAGTAPELIFTGAMSNGALIKAGAGTLSLTQANALTGALQIADGTLALNGNNQTVQSLAGTGALALGAAQLTVNSLAADNTTFSGATSGSGSVRQIGAGALTLSGANSFSGGLAITSGRVNVTSATGAGTAAIAVGPGATLQSGATLANSIDLSGGTISSQTAGSIGNGELRVLAASSIDLFNKSGNASSETIFTGTLRGTANLAVNAGPNQANADGGVALRLRGTTPSDFSGTLTAGPRVKFEIQMADPSAPDPFGTGKIVLTAGTSTGGLNGTYTQLQPRLAAGGVTYALGHPIEISGAGYVNVNLLGGADIIAQFGNLKIGGGQILGASKNDVINRSVEFPTVLLTGGIAEFRAYDPNFAVLTNTARGGSNILLGTISEAAAGSGIIFQSALPYVNEVRGVASYSGPTDVETGTLRIGESGSLASSSQIELSTGAKLDVFALVDGYAIPAAQKLVGSGDWDGRVLLSGTLAPGPGLATMTGDDLTLSGAGVMQFELSTTDALSDVLSLAGTFDKGVAGAFRFDFEGGGMAGQTYTLVQFAGSTFSASNFSFIDLAPGLTGTFQMTPTELQFAVAVPEPGSAAMLAGSLGALLGLRRFRRGGAARG